MAPARCAARFRRSALPSLGLPALALPASTGSTTIERTSASPCPESVLVVFLVVGLDRGLSRLGRLQAARSEDHTSEFQSLMRISYAFLCMKQKILTSNHYLEYVMKYITIHTNSPLNPI